ncbi:5793f46f-7ded-4739-9027-b1e21ef08ef9 [Thermothielavioides terrestris]|nr:5793f46f-7ded-4739-9027-b1e21ef08ef9 [Thermothielavioides terrestris]
MSWPSGSLFRFPPNPNSGFIPPPPAGSTPSAPPVTIPDSIYHAALDPRLPITVAVVYAVSAKALNAYNRSTGKRPWAISKTLAFRCFVILHNVFLALYSAWTFLGMLRTLRRAVVSPRGPLGFSGFLDSLCQLNGPRGLGNAAFFDDETNSWRSYSTEPVLNQDGVPSRLAAGRIWNEGLAFYGWLFYLSKFYEVFDTLIILAKGKLSSTLQTYHHAGAMLCMWAGMRYMAVPIWIFVCFNSFIHSIMYTYYTATALNIRVPMFIKRTLTSLQITQFVLGTSAAMVHSFINYTIPVRTNSQTDIGLAPPAINGSGGAATELDSLLDVEGAYDRQVMPCITSSGETFAIWLNVVYLLPLTYLFISFFVESYIRRGNTRQSSKRGAEGSAAAAVRHLSNDVHSAGWEAAQNVNREMYEESAEDEAVSAEGNQANGRVAANGRVLRRRH